MNQDKKDKSPYDCPNCGRTAEDFNGTYYCVEDGEAVFDLSSWDVEETGLTIPEEYFPKFGPKIFNDNPNCEGYEWEETHQCPKCGTVFSFTNGT